MDEKINYWDNVYGFDMSCIKETAMLEPLVDEVSGEAIVSSTDKVITIDIMTCTTKDLEFKVPFELKMQSKVCSDYSTEGRALRRPPTPPCFSHLSNFLQMTQMTTGLCARDCGLVRHRVLVHA